MLMDQAAEYLVSDYRATVTKVRLADFKLIIAMLGYLYPAVPIQLVMNEVIRQFSGSASRGL